MDGLFFMDGEIDWMLYYLIRYETLNFEFEKASQPLKAVLGLHFSKATVCYC